MRSKKRWWHPAPIAIAAAAVAAACVTPASATTLIRASLDGLTKANGTIVIGEVVDSYSYWNDEGSFILTDVELRIQEVMKGEKALQSTTVTIMGGTVGEISTLVLGAPSLELGNLYLLFLNEENLPGAESRLTVRDQCQGAFDILEIGGEIRARSQAWDFGLLPDALGSSQPPGLDAGLELGSLIQTISSLAKKPAGKPAERRTP